MPSTIGLTEAADALKEQFGARLESGHDEGVRLMSNALRERLGVSRHEADKLVRDLEDGQAIRWTAEREAPTPGIDSGTGETVGWELPIPAPVESGDWQL
ncbi:MAG: hypothetical protein U0822_03000 [Anaerolineae bacterium]